MSFSKNDSFYDESLDTFFGPKIQRYDETVGQIFGPDGSSFNYDRYRGWLMKVLIANGVNNYNQMVEKYPFIGKDIETDDEEEEEEEEDVNCVDE